MKKKIKSALLVSLTLALVSASAVAITWALNGETRFGTTNTFTNNPNIAVRLAEPLWDAQTYDSDATGSVIPTLPTGDKGFNIGPTSPETPVTDYTKYVNDPTLAENQQVDVGALGYNMAQKYQSASVLPKNPSLKNTSGDDDATNARSDNDDDSKNGNVSRTEWVAMGVNYRLNVPTTFYYLGTNTSGENGCETKRYNVIKASTTASSTPGSAQVQSYLAGKTIEYDSQNHFATALATLNHASSRVTDANETIDAEATTWTDISTGDKGTLFMYNTKLAQNANTNTLFDSVTINTFTLPTDENAATNYIYAKDQNGKELVLYRIDLTGASIYDTTSKVVKDETAKKSVLSTDSYNGEATETQYIYVDTLPEFVIDLSGYAVQGDALNITDDANSNYTTIKTELKALANR